MSAAALKLTAYFGERKRTQHDFIARVLLDLYGRHGIATSILLRGTEGFGRKHHVRTDSTLSLSEDLPAVAIAVDNRDRIEAVLAEAAEIVGAGLLTLERARLVIDDLTGADVREPTKLTVYLGRQDHVAGKPAYAAVCDLLYHRGIAGATTMLGVDGTVHGRREQARFFSRNLDVPVMVIAVGPGDGIARVLPELAGMLDKPLVTLERVRVCKRDGQLLEAPHELPATDEHGWPVWQKLTVFTSEAQLHRGRPIHRSLMRRLRETGAVGATTVRGIWGYHGEHAPHGDRAFQLGRHVPTVTTVIDAPDRIAASFAVIDEVTHGHGLVTSELVPAVSSISERELNLE